MLEKHALVVQNGIRTLPLTALPIYTFKQTSFQAGRS
jgi:hypothetical protein